MKPFKGVIHAEDTDRPAYGERYTGFVIGWNDTHISITTSPVVGIQPIREDICLIETFYSIYLVDLDREDDDVLYQEKDALDL